MGFIRNLMKLSEMGNDEMERMDVGARAASAIASMDQLTASMNAGSFTGAGYVTAQGTVMSVRQTGTMVNQNPLLEITLMVLAPGAAPRPVTATMVVPFVQFARVQPGAVFAVSYDPAVPASLTINWAA